MKSIIHIVITLFSICVSAQAPDGFNYQASVRDGSGSLVVSQSVSFKFHIIQGTQTATPTYSETHATNTDDLGQVSLVIGQGNATSGAFSSVDWSLGSYFLKIEVELSAGSGYVDLGTTQFMSVPYALYAQNAGGSLPQGTSNGDTIKWNASSSSWVISSGSNSILPIIISTDEHVYSDLISDHTNEKFILSGIGYVINSDGGNTINSKGIVFGTSSDPNIGNDTVIDDGPGKESNSNLSINLNENTLYYYRAFATNSNGTYYGDTYVIETSDYIDNDPDNDGVIDDQDSCPNTSSGDTVDVNGCSDSQKDTDNDGVLDDQDNCPNTSLGDTIDVNGCSDSQKDTDNDGVNDSIDYCPNSSTGDNVTEFGCTLDEQQQQGYIYLDSNGITVKANPWAVTGKVYSLNGVEYSIVDNNNFNWWGNFNVCTTRITNMSNLFNINYLNGKEIYEGIDINSWDTSNVRNMDSMFFNNDQFNYDISAWDTSSVESMYNMFSYNDAFNQDISQWNTSNVTTMQAMFSYNTAFNQDISQWNTGNVISMRDMFRNSNFNNSLANWIIASDATQMFYSSYFNHPSASSFDTGNVTTMLGMFRGNPAFNQDISQWNTSNVTTMQAMFYSTTFNNNLANWIIAPNASEMFKHSAFNHPSASTFDISNVTNMSSMFSYNTAFNQDISQWNTSNVTNMSSMFEYSTYSNSLANWVIAANATRMFQKSAFNHPSASTFDTSNVTNMDYMFYDDKTFNQDISQWNTGNVTNMSNMFESAENFNQDIGKWNIYNVNYMGSMFRGAVFFNQDLSSWNTIHVYNYHDFDRGATRWTLPKPVFN